MIKIKYQDRNLNKGTDKGRDMVQRSIDKFGMRDAVVIDKNGEIISGNHRKKAATKRGITKERIIEANSDEVIAIQYNDIDLSTPEGKELALALNQTAKFNINIDEEVAIEELGDVVEEWGIEIPVELEAEEDDFDMPDEVKTDIVIGDLFEIGEHRLICGDSTQTDTFKKLFEDNFADMVITDPPYNVAYEGKTKDKLTIQNDKQSDGDFYKFLYDFYTAMASYTKPGGAWYVWHADSEGANFRKAMIDAGIMVKQCLIWVKNSMVMGRQDYQWKHEPCLYGWKDGAAHSWYSDRKQTTILEFDRPNRNAEHPTMKPIPLFSYQIKNSSKPGDIVADAFGGSGTTMVACHQLQRKGYLVEYDPKYCQVIIDRMLKLDPSLKITRNGQPYEAK